MVYIVLRVVYIFVCYLDAYERVIGVYFLFAAFISSSILNTVGAQAVWPTS